MLKATTLAIRLRTRGRRRYRAGRGGRRRHSVASHPARLSGAQSQVASIADHHQQTSLRDSIRVQLALSPF